MDRQDQDLVLLLATSSGSLASAPGDQDNWIERAGSGGRGGELPKYVRKIARAIMKSGKTKSQAIAIAISRIKRWAAGGDGVDADTQAKAAKALAQWEALKAKNASKKLVKASRPDGTSYVMLANTGPFNVDLVRRAWSTRQYELETISNQRGDAAPISYGYITEMWTDHIIVERSSTDPQFVRVPYSVDGDTVTFGEAEPVKHAWVKDTSFDLSPAEKALLSDVFTVKLSSPLERIQKLGGQ